MGPRIHDVDELGERLAEVLNASNLDARSQMAALLDVMHACLAGIQCPDCRRLQADAAREQMPVMLDSAMAAPSERTHVH
jgi:hypothetical protein